MTYRVKVSKPAGPEYFYALGNEALDTLLERIYAAGPVSLVLWRLA